MTNFKNILQVFNLGFVSRKDSPLSHLSERFEVLVEGSKSFAPVVGIYG